MDKRLQAATVRWERRILDAMQVLEGGGLGIAFVVDEVGRLVGTLTDGDLRRGLLKGATLESPLASCVQRNFTPATPDSGRAEILDIMQARTLEQIPIVDADGRLVGVHLLHEILGAVRRPNWAVVMAGGRGTRLLPLTERMPKPMLRVAGRPLLERIVLHLVSFGIRRIFIAVNYLAHLVEGHFGNGERFGCTIEYLREKEEMPLGTGGAISLLPKPPQEPLIVMNGDLMTQANIRGIVDFHDGGPYFATMGVKRYYHQVPFGCVELEGPRISHLEEKPILEKTINAGIYVLSPEVAARVPHQPYPITQLFEDCLRRREPIGAYEIEDDWIDVGRRDQLKAAQEGGS
jgi:dTDP-glucose pyrophosphorylase